MSLPSCMCGIGGLVRFGAPPADPGVAGRLLDALAHRGPDGGGTYVSQSAGACLAHRRLAIIAPGDEGRQPMTMGEGRHWLVFNGEIYNYRELRQSLGGEWRTGSDTEVLLRLVVEQGPAGLSRLRGMFAFAWWDEAEGRLLVARDRFGIKPLYVSATAERVAFASETRALVNAGLVERRPRAAAVLAYLRWAAVPAPLTWLEGVDALLPGEWRSWGRDGRETRGRFVDVREAWVTGEHAPAGADDVEARVREGVVDAVRAHLVADVPVGVFLSGGLDSAAIVKACRTLGRDDLRAFTVTTGDAADQAEARAAAVVARAYGIAHETLRVEAADVVREWPRLLRHLDQPTADGWNTWLVAGAVARAGMRSVLSGLGGDELLGGYPSFTRLPRAARLTALAPGAAASLGRAASALAAPARAARWRQALRSRGARPEVYRALRGFLMPDEIDALAGPALRDGAAAAVDAVEREMLDARGDERPAASAARLETCGYMRHQLLRDVDVMSMAHGLEVRTPFVDHELLARTWPDLGAHPSLVRRKAVLRRWLAEDLPSEVTSRPKRGFLLPFADWLDGPLAGVARDGLAVLGDGGWLAPGTPDAVWQDWRARRTHWTRPWGLAVLGHVIAHD